MKTLNLRCSASGRRSAPGVAGDLDRLALAGDDGVLAGLLGRDGFQDGPSASDPYVEHVQKPEYLLCAALLGEPVQNSTSW
jgi:hypothetical protein